MKTVFCINFSLRISVNGKQNPYVRKYRCISFNIRIRPLSRDGGDEDLLNDGFKLITQ